MCYRKTIAFFKQVKPLPANRLKATFVNIKIAFYITFYKNMFGKVGDLNLNL